MNGFIKLFLIETINNTPKNKTSYLPIVEMKVVVKASSENLNKIQVFPTPESPINNNLNNKSYVFFAIFVLTKMINNFVF